MQTREMNTDQVRAMAAVLSLGSTALKAVSSALEIQMNILEKTAFIGNVGGTAVARYLQVIQPVIEQLAKDFENLSTMAKNSAKQWDEAAQAG